MRTRAGEEPEPATVTAARQLAQEAQQRRRAPRPPARERLTLRAIGAEAAGRRRPELTVRPE